MLNINIATNLVLLPANPEIKREVGGSVSSHIFSISLTVSEIYPDPAKDGYTSHLPFLN